MHANIASEPHPSSGSGLVIRGIAALHNEWASAQRALHADQLPLACLDRFTLREREVLQLLVTRHTNREIARLLSISERTVETHVANVLRKLDAANRREVAERVGAWVTAG
jgi:DNA-binding NarL/FixJ family response regulator